MDEVSPPHDEPGDLCGDEDQHFGERFRHRRVGVKDPLVPRSIVIAIGRVRDDFAETGVGLSRIGVETVNHVVVHEIGDVDGTLVARAKYLDNERRFILEPRELIRLGKAIDDAGDIAEPNVGAIVARNEEEVARVSGPFLVL